MAIPLIPTLLFFDPQSEEKGKEKTQALRGTQPKKEHRLFCATCRYPVTHQNQRISMQGGHEHRFTNPLGITYSIGCFREAPGCMTMGEPTMEYTWFKGFLWRIALCAHCHAHLGWHFQAEGEYFHGLIINRLTSAGPEKN